MAHEDFDLDVHHMRCHEDEYLMKYCTDEAKTELLEKMYKFLYPEGRPIVDGELYVHPMENIIRVCFPRNALKHHIRDKIENIAEMFHICQYYRAVYLSPPNDIDKLRYTIDNLIYYASTLTRNKIPTIFPKDMTLLPLHKIIEYLAQRHTHAISCEREVMIPNSFHDRWQFLLHNAKSYSERCFMIYCNNGKKYALNAIPEDDDIVIAFGTAIRYSVYSVNNFCAILTDDLQCPDPEDSRRFLSSWETASLKYIMPVIERSGHWFKNAKQMLSKHEKMLAFQILRQAGYRAGGYEEELYNRGITPYLS